MTLKSHIRGAIAAALIVCATTMVAHAHGPHIKKMTPQFGATVTQVPTSVSLDFAEAMEATAHTMQVFKDGTEEQVDVGTPVASADQMKLSVGLKPITAGKYRVKWSLKGTDGHDFTGNWTFTVK